jgi:hypothetical protein
MAVITAQGIASVAIALLNRSLALPRTVTRVPGGDYDGPNGGTISVRVRQPRSANTQSSPGASLSATAASEIAVDVSIANIYDLHNLTDQEANYELEDFAFQVTRPQVEAVAIGAEDTITTVMNALDADLSFANTATEADTKDTILAARETLGEADVPAGNRWLAVSPSIASRLLSVDLFVRADASGSTSALRQAILGSIYGFTVVESNGLTEDTALAYHNSGFVFANRTPMNPRGATESAAVSEQGVGLRQVFQYNAATASDQSLISTFAGAAAVVEDESSPPTAARYVKLDVSSS